jgi:hypothetical protein
MYRSVALSILLSFAACSFAHASAADPDTTNIPDPKMSSWDARLGRSPLNLEVNNATFQYSYSGTLRNVQGQPIPGWPASDIVLEIRTPCQSPVTLHPDGNTDVNGLVRWGAAKLDQGGGSCSGPQVAVVRLLSIGIYKSLSSVTSPDENGNTEVDLPDLGVFQQAFINGSPLYQGDLNLSSGVPDLADLTFFQRHFTAQR